MPPRLILNADDFGLTPGINRAIAELHIAGVLTSATLMATGPAFDDAVSIAHSLPTLGVGCHIVLVDGVPVSHPDTIPTLIGVDAKTFRPSLLDFTQAVLRSTIDPGDILREALAQIQKLQRAGIDVTHLDTHKHTHMFPAVAAPLLQLAERCGIGAIRNPFELTSTPPSGTLTRRLQLKLLRRFRPAFRALLQLRLGRVLTSDAALGIAATGSLDTQTLERILTHLPAEGIYELVCHPGYSDAALEALPGRLRASRDIERDALRAILPGILSQPNAPTLIHYGNLGGIGVLRELGLHQPQTGHETIL